MPKLLTFVEKTHPILREIMPEVLDFSEHSLHEAIEAMCFSILPKQLKDANASYTSAAGMAANQWGIKKRVFIFTPEGSDPGNTMEVMINPSYTPHLRSGESEPKMIAGYEGCFSIPLTVGIVNRYEAITATYHNRAGEKIQRVMQGWEARVFQHETDHLNGKLYDGRLDNFPGPPCLERKIFKNKEDMENFWQTQVKESRGS